MGDLKLAKDLFLETEELNRLKKALKDDGYQLDFQNLYETPGIVRNRYYDPSFSYFQVLATNVPDSIAVAPGFAYDSSRKVLTSTGATLLIPQRNTFYWLKIAYKTHIFEQGTVSIGGATGGLMSGNGTAFTTVLRGSNNFPSRIKFINSVNYQDEYEVLEVDSDGTAYLQGNFPVKEVNLQYAVVGTFTPGVYPADSDKFPFQYDDFTYTLVAETGTDVQPDLQPGVEFFIARVFSDTTGAVQIQDRRQFFIAETRNEHLLTELPTKENPIIGIESIDKTAIRTGIFYNINFQWGFRIVGESRNYNINTTTIIAGSGGTYGSANAFTTGDFDGWRYYYQDGSWSRIVSSVKNGTGFDLKLDTLNSRAIGAMICPNAEEIEVEMSYFIATATGTGQKYKTRREKFFIFTLNPTLTISQDELDTNFLEVDLRYRFKTVLQLTDYQNFNPNAYVVPGLSQVVSNNILLSINASTPTTTTAWRGINSFCVVDTLSTPIYYKILLQNIVVQPTQYLPNSSFPQTSNDNTTADMYVQFFSDAGLTTPMNVTHPNLRIVVKQTSTITQSTYDTQYPGSEVDTTFVNEALLVFKINPAGVNNMFLQNVITVGKAYQHPTNQVGNRRIIVDDESVFNVFPSNTLVVGYTGDEGFNDLEEYYTANSKPTGNTKPNLINDPNYIAPAQNVANCPIIPVSISLFYGYLLNVNELVLNGTVLGAVSGPVVETESATSIYILPAYNANEQVTIKARVSTLDSGNASGFIWVRVTWKAPGSNSVTYTNIQIPNGVETTLSQVFTNIQVIQLSNY